MRRDAGRGIAVGPCPMALAGAALAGVALAACLVFNGKVATEFDDGGPDGSAAAGDAATVADAGPDAPSLTPEPGIFCWPGFGTKQYCPFGDACCIAYGNDGWFEAPTLCQANGTCGGDGFVALACDSPFDCVDSGLPSAVCCLTPNVGSTCVSGAECPAPGLILCDPLDRTPCPAAATCVEMTDSGVVPPGYHACQ